jgi:hypothetical protein
MDLDSFGIINIRKLRSKGFIVGAGIGMISWLISAASIEIIKNTIPTIIEKNNISSIIGNVSGGLLIGLLSFLLVQKNKKGSKIVGFFHL